MGNGTGRDASGSSSRCWAKPEKRTEPGRPFGHPDSAPYIRALLFGLISRLLRLRLLRLDGLFFGSPTGFAAFAFCSLPKRKTAECWLPSTRVTISFRQVPAHRRSVFQMYV